MQSSIFMSDLSVEITACHQPGRIIHNNNVTHRVEDELTNTWLNVYVSKMSHQPTRRHITGSNSNRWVLRKTLLEMWSSIIDPADEISSSRLHLCLHFQRSSFLISLNFISDHRHWRRQLWGTGARAPRRLPASYFGDRSLYRLWRVMRTVFCPVANSSHNTSNWRPPNHHANDATLIVSALSTERKAIANNAAPVQCSTLCPQFSSGSNYSSQNVETIANKFQLHTYFRFR